MGEGKATESLGHLGCGDAPATPPSPLPHPTTGHNNSGACSGQAQPSRRFARMGNEVRQPHRQQQVAKILQQEYGQGAAGTPQEHQGWVKRPQGWLKATQKWEWVAVMPQQMWVVAQPPEAKVGGASNPLPLAAEPPQPWAGGSDPPPWYAPVQHVPPNLLAGRILTAQQPLSPPPRWPHLSLGGLPLLPILPPRAGEPAFHPSRLGLATLPVWWVP